jgi:hypothetical protein
VFIVLLADNDDEMSVLQTNIGENYSHVLHPSIKLNVKIEIKNASWYRNTAFTDKKVFFYRQCRKESIGNASKM